MPHAGNHVVTLGRTLMAVLAVLGWRPALLASVYLHDGQGIGLGGQASAVEVQCNKWQYFIGGDFNYVMKIDGRLAGPWKDCDFNFMERPPMTRQLETFMANPMRPWQTSLLQVA